MAAADRELIKQFQAGNRAAFDELVRRHYNRAYAIAYRMLGDQDLAQDAVQAAFLRAYRGLPSYKQSAAFTTWLYRIVVNVCLDTSRRRNRTPATSLDTSPEDEGPSLGERLPDDGQSPEEVLLQRERALAVQEALLALSPRYRTVLVLYEVQGLAYEEVAEVLKVPVGTVKSRLNRARAAFAEQFAERLELFGLAPGQRRGVETDEE
ncbi:MAG: sigma-70 family RNA polymerase sigma factor [Armatimonadetes bacterium]|nr:sigma-70 family RNA polymerase sigma factor [Armatimonadota bacterium]